jgi:predicted pyridoxine 5'-phosphate oxidase superfamily flavin-nucleotide-binding protein
MTTPIEILESFESLCAPAKPLVWLSTSRDGVPHLVPVCFVKPIGSDQLIVGNVFIRRTAANLKINPHVALAVAFNRQGWDGYLVKGRAKLLDKGDVFEDFKEEVQKISGDKRKIHSAIIVNVEEVYSLKPGDGKKRLH